MYHYASPRPLARGHPFDTGLIHSHTNGGVKHCLNTKIAACRVQIKDRALGIQETLETRNRAAFEIMTDDRTHGIPMAARGCY